MASTSISDPNATSPDHDCTERAARQTSALEALIELSYALADHVDGDPMICAASRLVLDLAHPSLTPLPGAQHGRSPP